MSRGTRGTPEKNWHGRFLEAFRSAGTVKAACEAAGIGRSTVYRERQANEEFALAWAAIEEDTTDELEVEAVRRAKDGSDTLLIFLLKCRRPHKYQDRARVEHSGPDGAAIRTEQSWDLKRLDADDLAVLRRIAERATPDV